MQRKAAVLDGTLVTNVVLVEDEFDPGPGLTLRDVAEDEAVGPGWSLAQDGTWQAPPPAAEVTDEARPVTRVEFDALMTMVLEAL